VADLCPCGKPADWRVGVRTRVDHVCSGCLQPLLAGVARGVVIELRGLEPVTA
jgi:hypothetical protein